MTDPTPCEPSGAPTSSGICSGTGKCEKFARSTSDKAMYCVPNPRILDPTACQTAEPSDYVSCNTPFVARGVFSLDAEGKGQGCAFNCEPPAGAAGFVDAWPPKLTCSGDGSKWSCKDNSSCTTNYYYDPQGQESYQSASSVCMPQTAIKDKKDCDKSNPGTYLTCPDNYEAKRFFQDKCFFACQKGADDGGWNWMLIIIIIAAAVGGIFLLMLLFHHKS